jgi:simple sugar transport system permease protein
MATDKADLVPQRKDAVRRAAPRSLVSRAGLFLLRSREASIAIAGIVLIIYFQSTASAFLSPSNIGNLAEYTAMTAIIAAGLVMVLIAGEVDLSVGQVYALSPFVMYFASKRASPLFPRSGLGSWQLLS